MKINIFYLHFLLIIKWLEHRRLWILFHILQQSFIFICCINLGGLKIKIRDKYWDNINRQIEIMVIIGFSILSLLQTISGRTFSCLESLRRTYSDLLSYFLNRKFYKPSTFTSTFPLAITSATILVGVRYTLSGCTESIFPLSLTPFLNSVFIAVSIFCFA